MVPLEAGDTDLQVLRLECGAVLKIIDQGRYGQPAVLPDLTVAYSAVNFIYGHASFPLFSGPEGRMASALLPVLSGIIC